MVNSAIYEMRDNGTVWFSFVHTKLNDNNTSNMVGPFEVMLVATVNLQILAKHKIMDYCFCIT